MAVNEWTTVTLLVLIGGLRPVLGGNIEGCPSQCSCTLQRTYGDGGLGGDADQLEVLCNRYAGDHGADMTVSPNLTALRSNGRPLALTIEQMDLEELRSDSLRGQRLRSLTLIHNDRLRLIGRRVITDSADALETLIVINNDLLQDVPLQAAGRFGRLRTLRLKLSQNCSEEDDGDRCPTPDLQHLVGLENLSLQGQRFRRNLAQLAKLNRLTHLTLIDLRLADRELNASQPLFSTDRLLELSLRDNRLTDLPRSVLSVSRRLQSLSLENNQIKIDRSFPDWHLIASVSLESLDLRGNNFQQFPCSIFDVLQKFPQLRNLKLDSDVNSWCLRCQSAATIRRNCRNGTDIPAVITEPRSLHVAKESVDPTETLDVAATTEEKNNQESEEIVDSTTKTVDRPDMERSVMTSTVASRTLSTSSLVTLTSSDGDAEPTTTSETSTLPPPTKPTRTFEAAAAELRTSTVGGTSTDSSTTDGLATTTITTETSSKESSNESSTDIPIVRSSSVASTSTVRTTVGASTVAASSVVSTTTVASSTINGRIVSKQPTTRVFKTTARFTTEATTVSSPTTSSTEEELADTTSVESSTIGEAELTSSVEEATSVETTSVERIIDTAESPPETTDYYTDEESEREQIPESVTTEMPLIDSTDVMEWETSTSLKIALLTDDNDPAAELIRRPQPVAGRDVPKLVETVSVDQTEYFYDESVKQPSRN